MIFWEAAKALHEGKKIRISHWAKDEFLYLSKDEVILDNDGMSFQIYPRVFKDHWEIHYDIGAKSMNLNVAGYNLVKHFEECRLKAYQDSGGIWTIGWGHTGPEVHQGLMWTQAQADKQLEYDLQWAEKLTQLVYSHTGYSPTDNEFSATVSFVYNVRDGATILKRILETQGMEGFPSQCEKYCHDSKGNILNGLKNRREAEKALYNQGRVA